MLLMAAVLLAQWNGMQHGIAHAHWQHDRAFTTLAASATDGSSNEPRHPQHSCLLTDAASMAEAILVFAGAALVVRATYAKPAWRSCIPWNAPLAFHFSPRAPPTV